MSGLTFHRTQKYEEVVSYYKENMNMTVWLEQGGCTILQKGNFLLGFCDRDEADTDGMITFFFNTREEVDHYYSIFKEQALGEPKETPQYRIYHFFTKDPEGRNVEFQTFLHHTLPHSEGSEMLRNRRSIRKFTDEAVDDDVLKEIFENCRYAPTSCNSQSYYFKLIRNRETLDKLSVVRGGSSAPIGRADMAVIVYCDNEKTKRPEQDGAIASTYFILAASQSGVGTCWIGGMDRDDVKEIAGIDKDHHIAMVSPVGWPGEYKVFPQRRELTEFVEGLS